MREDADFIYYDVAIKDLVNSKLDIRVESGQITISGTIEKKRLAGMIRKNPTSSIAQLFAGHFLCHLVLMILERKWSRMVR